MYPTILDSSDEANRVARAYRQSGVPLHYIIDAEGKIVHGQYGSGRGFPKLRRILNGLVGGVVSPPPDDPGHDTLERDELPAPASVTVRGKARIHGLAVDAAGFPLKQTRISLVSDELDIRKITTSDQEGKFTFRRLPAATYIVTLEVNPSDVETHVKKEITVTDTETVDIRFEKE